MSSFEELMAAALAVIEEHNAGASSAVSFEEVRRKLTELGATSIEALRHVEASDLEEAGVPKVRARQIAELFKSGGSSPQAGPRRINDRYAPHASVVELVAAYDPSQPTTPAAEEMRKRSGDRAHVVFDRDGGVHRKATATLLQELVDGGEPREFYTVGDRPHPVYKVGERPPVTVDEHPLYPGQELRLDGTDKLGINWRDGISLEVRRLLYLAIATAELQIRDTDQVHDIHARAMVEGAAGILRSRYLKASACYDQLEGQGNLPSLKVERARGGSSTSKQDPFGGATHRRY